MFELVALAENKSEIHYNEFEDTWLVLEIVPGGHFAGIYFRVWVYAQNVKHIRGLGNSVGNYQTFASDPKTRPLGMQWRYQFADGIPQALVDLLSLDACEEGYRTFGTKDCESAVRLMVYDHFLRVSMGNLRSLAQGDLMEQGAAIYLGACGVLEDDAAKAYWTSFVSRFSVEDLVSRLQTYLREMAGKYGPPKDPRIRHSAKTLPKLHSKTPDFVYRVGMDLLLDALSPETKEEGVGLVERHTMRGLPDSMIYQELLKFVDEHHLVPMKSPDYALYLTPITSDIMRSLQVIHLQLGASSRMG